MYLLFNDLIYSLIYEERESDCTDEVYSPHHHFLRIFTTAKVIHMLELSKHFSDIFYPSCLYNRFLDLLKRIRAQPTRFVQVCAPNARGLASDAT